MDGRLEMLAVRRLLSTAMSGHDPAVYTPGEEWKWVMPAHQHEQEIDGGDEEGTGRNEDRE